LVTLLLVVLGWVDPFGLGGSHQKLYHELGTQKAGALKTPAEAFLIYWNWMLEI